MRVAAAETSEAAVVVAIERSPQKISALQLFAYGGPAFVLFLLWVPVTVYLPQLYAKFTGMSFTTIGTVIVCSKVADAVFDQVIGIISDRTTTVWGRRKPWLLAGTAVMLASLYFLFHPTRHSGPIYLALALNGFYVGWSMILIPYSAMAPEIARGGDVRTRLAGAYGLGTMLGQLTFNLLPIGLFLAGLSATSEYSIGVLGATFWLCAALAPVLILLAVTLLPNGSGSDRRARSLRTIWVSLRANKPFLIYAAAFFLFTAASGVQAAVAFTFYDSYLHIGAELPYLVLVVVAATTLSVPAWSHISRRVGKHRALAAGWIVYAIALQGYWLLSPGAMAPFVLAALMLVIGFSQGINPVSQNAIIADVVDYGQLKTGESSAGSYYAAQTFLMKVAQATGAGGGFMLVGLFGFAVRPGAHNGPAAIRGLFVTLVLAPSVLIMLALVLIRLFPLDRRRVVIIERRLEARRARSEHSLAMR